MKRKGKGEKKEVGFLRALDGRGWGVWWRVHEWVSEEKEKEKRGKTSRYFDEDDGLIQREGGPKKARQFPLE